MKLNDPSFNFVVLPIFNLAFSSTDLNLIHSENLEYYVIESNLDEFQSSCSNHSSSPGSSKELNSK